MSKSKEKTIDKTDDSKNKDSKAINLARNPKYQSVAAVIIVLAAAILGYLLFSASHAASPFVSSEAEGGTLSGAATTVSGDSTASGNSYVRFGALPSSSGTGSSGTGTGNQYCGFAPGTHPTKVMVIWEENEDSSTIVGDSAAPYLNTLAKECALATNYSADGHPSLPNYMATTSGTMSTWTGSPWATNPGDCNAGGSCSTSNASVFSQLGPNWKGYAESMSGNCSTSDSTTYAQRHNPAVYYTNITNACQVQDVPLGSTSSGALLTDVNNGTLPLLSTVTPNIYNDGHTSNGSCAGGNEMGCIDAWLKSWIPIIIAGPDYKTGKLAILVQWDEGVNTNQTVVFGMSAGMTVNGTTGISDGTSYNNVSVTHTIDQITGQSNLGISATSMYAGFKF